MGIYVYTLRKQTAAVAFADGVVDANLYAYAYKDWLSDSWDPAVERRRNFIRANATRTGDRAWRETPHAAAVVGDKFEDGVEVYVDLRAPEWVDCNNFPGRVVGWLRLVGRRWTVVDATPWSAWTEHGTDGPRPIWRRLAIYDGAIVQERIDRPADSDGTWWEVPGQRPAAPVCRVPEPHPVY